MSNFVLPDDDQQLPWAMTLPELLDRMTAQAPNKVYLYYQGYHVTYEEFRHYILKTANLFRSLGVGHGDRVCAFLPNGREFPFIWFGLAHLGAICVPINTAYKQEEMAYILNNAEAKALVAHHTLMDVAQEAAQVCPSLQARLVVGGDPDTPPPWERGRCGSLDRLLDAAQGGGSPAVSRGIGGEAR